MTRFISDDERDALDAAQQQLHRDNRARSRRSALTVIVFAVLALATAALAGAYLGGRL
jgi:hypothetical protein